MNKIISLSMAVALVLLTAACEKDNGQNVEIPEVTVGAYIINNGNFGSNDASIMYYDSETGTVTSDVFYAANGYKVGDCAQDMVIYGSKMYIGIYNSAVIYVTDLNCKVIKTITHENTRSPRALIADNGKIYVTYYEGYVGKIDTLNYNEKEVTVGNNPEQLRISNNKLYVANSGGMNYPDYDNTVSVIDINTFTLAKTLQVVTNPQWMEVDSQGDIYLISTGNYNDVPSTLQRIDTETDEVSSIDGITASWMALGKDDKLYIVSSQYDANWNMVADYYVYDTKTETLTGKFITDGTVVEEPYYISADPVSGNVYIGTSDYKTNGSMYVFSEDGKCIDKFETGLNPIGAYFVRN